MSAEHGHTYVDRRRVINFNCNTTDIRRSKQSALFCHNGHSVSFDKNDQKDRSDTRRTVGFPVADIGRERNPIAIGLRSRSRVLTRCGDVGPEPAERRRTDGGARGAVSRPRLEARGERSVKRRAANASVAVERAVNRAGKTYGGFAWQWRAFIFRPGNCSRPEWNRSEKISRVGSHDSAETARRHDDEECLSDKRENGH